MSEQQRDAIGAAHAVAASMDALSKKVENLNTRMGLSEADRRTLHRSTRWNMILAAVAVLLAGWLLFQQFTVNSSRASVTALHSSTVSVCQQSNGRLAQQAALWHYLIQKSTIPKDASAKERALARRELARIGTLVNSAFRLRDCTRLYRK